MPYHKFGSARHSCDLPGLTGCGVASRACLVRLVVAIGAVVVAGGRVIGRGHNQTERLTDVTAHAEMLALTAAARTLRGKYLSDATLYVTR